METNRPDRLVHERILWERGIRFIAGVDEAGRGPLAGPVVAAAVIFYPGENIPGVRDSKRLSADRRETLFPVIRLRAVAVAVESVSESDIDRINILQATYLAMRRAVANLAIQPEHILVDGRAIPDVPCPQTGIVHGDDRSLSIAAASIVAKVTRDRLMVQLDEQYPEYGFARHKGYGTRDHVLAIRRYGPCPVHRKSFSVQGWAL